MTFKERCKSIVKSLDLCASEDVSSIQRLTGGVASDIAKVSFGSQAVCVKFALEKLQVKEDWFAPAHRGQAEYAWLSVAGSVAPESAPKLYGWSDNDNGFAMEFISGSDIYLWKTYLLEEETPQGEAQAVARTIARIHAASTKPDFDKSPFDNGDDFESLRTSPYLRFTAEHHPDLAPMLLKLADELKTSQTALVHGDVSPKNIIMRNGVPVILDAECATMGDPAFDTAFCLNHLVLKAVHLPKSSALFLAEASAFWQTYIDLVDWEEKNQIEQRTTALLPALMLARVDGKSPVEYLSEASRASVRKISIPLIKKPKTTVADILSAVMQETCA